MVGFYAVATCFTDLDKPTLSWSAQVDLCVLVFSTHLFNTIQRSSINPCHLINHILNISLLSHLPFSLVSYQPSALRSTYKTSSVMSGRSSLEMTMTHYAYFIQFSKRSFILNLICPKCQSERIRTNNYAKKVGGTVGCVAGATSAASSALTGARIGATVGLVAGPIGVGLGTIAGAIVGILLGGATGCAVGSKLGEVVDKNVLDNFQCLDCGYSFSQEETETEQSFCNS